MPLTINFIGSTADIKHVNLRKQGNEDDRVLAIDVKVSGEVQASILNDLLGASPGEDMTGMFWSTMAGTDPDSLRTHALGDIPIRGEWPNRIAFIGKHSTTCDVKKISIEPRPGHRLDLTAQLSIESPSDELLDYAVYHIQENVTCRIESRPELPLGHAPVKTTAP